MLTSRWAQRNVPTSADECETSLLASNFIHLSKCLLFQVDRKTDALLCDCGEDAAGCLMEPTLDLNAGEKSHLISAELNLQQGSRLERRERGRMFLTSWCEMQTMPLQPSQRVRDLASGRLLNGREQTAGAGEQTEQPHQKAEGVNRGWTTDDEVRQSGHFPQLNGSGWWLLEPNVMQISIIQCDELSWGTFIIGCLVICTNLRWEMTN